MNDRILKILKANGLDREEHIVRMSNQDLLRLKGIGKKAVQIIRQIYGPPLIGWPVKDQCEYLGIEYIKMEAKWDSQGFHNFNWYDATTGKWLFRVYWGRTWGSCLLIRRYVECHSIFGA